MPSADTTPQLTLDTFEDASKRVKEVTQETKLIYSPHFSKETGNDVYLKPENMQRTGAYKVRGAYYKICLLYTSKGSPLGPMTASACSGLKACTLSQANAAISLPCPSNFS